LLARQMLGSIWLGALLAEGVQAQLDQLGCLVRRARFGRWAVRGRPAQAVRGRPARVRHRVLVISVVPGAAIGTVTPVPVSIATVSGQPLDQLNGQAVNAGVLGRSLTPSSSLTSAQPSRTTSAWASRYGQARRDGRRRY
jgi:hypothetical protein